MTISVTDKAVSQLRDIMQEQNVADHHLRMGVSGGGCSGLEYFLAFDDEVADSDTVFEFGGLKVLVDGESAEYLDGASLDFSTDLNNSGFIFNNPNAKRTCGCGKSFCS